MLTGNEIVRRLGTDIIITPFDNTNLNPNSYNITLDNELLVYKRKDHIPDFLKEGYTRLLDTKIPLDMKKQNDTERIIIPETGYVLEPGKIYLGKTVEYTETYNLVPCIDGRSSVGRLGINIHATAGFGDVGFKGVWTLEISCIEPVIIYPYIKIGQIYYETLDGVITMQYNGKYQNQNDIIASEFYKDNKDL